MVKLKFDCFGSKLMVFNENEILGFTLCGADKKWQPARAKLVDGTTVEVWSDKINAPIAVRYAWSETPVCNLFSVDGLPLTPFRTDDFDLHTRPEAGLTVQTNASVIKESNPQPHPASGNPH